MTSHDSLSDAHTGRELPVVRKIGVRDLSDALSAGFADFRSKPTHLFYLFLIYPVVGLLISRAFLGVEELVPMLFPMAAGFALVGPLAAIGLYELSRRRERGEDPTWREVFSVVQSPSIGAIARVGALVLAIFFLWLAAAQVIYILTFGDEPPESLRSFVRDVLTTPEGWTLIVAGNGVGFVFAVLTLMVSVVSFPLLVDRNVGAAVAIATSMRAVMANLWPMAVWGLIVAAALVIGTLPAFVGLALVVPVLGHATWHLYRKVIAP